MRYQKIESRIWTDEKFKTLTAMQQRLWFYLLTCQHGNLIGIYVLGEGYACHDLKLMPKDFRKDLDNILSKDLAKYDAKAEIIWVKNFLKYNPLTNPNQVKAAKKILVNLPKSSLILDFLTCNPNLAKGLPEGFIEGLSEDLLKPETEYRKQKQKTETEDKKNIAPPGLRPEGAGIFFSCKFFSVNEEYRGKLANQYPAITNERLLLELSKMEDWISDNQKSKKFKATGEIQNPKLFIRNWLERVMVKGEGGPTKEPKMFQVIRESRSKRGGNAD